MRSKSRLRARLLALGLVATVPALVVILYAQSLERERTRARVVEDIRQVAGLAASEQVVFLNGVQRLLLTLSRFPSLREASPADCQALLPSILHDHPGYINIWVVAADGTPFCEAAPNAATAADNRARTWFQRAVAARTTVASDFQISMVTGKPDVVMAIPLLTATGAVDRILAASVSVDQLNGIAAQVRLPPSGTLTLFDRQGRIVARVPDGDRWIGQTVPAAMHPPAAGAPDAVPGMPGVTDVRDIIGIDGGEKLYTTTRVAAELDTGLVIGVSVDRDAAFAPAAGLLRQQAVVLLIVLIATMSAALIGGEWFLMRPVSVMTEVTGRLAAGDFTARARLHGGVPGLPELATAVNAMAAEMETRDIERRAAEDALRASEDHVRHAQKLEAVGQLAAGIAHNFNNLLTVIVGFTELLLANHQEPSQEREDLEEIDKAARRGASLTRQLLTFSRKHEAVSRRLDLNQVVTQMREMLTRVIRDDIRVTIEPARTPAPIAIDPSDLEQVVLNLVLNARDAQPTGGRIHIDITHVTIPQASQAAPGVQGAPGNYVRLRVRDAGTGMTPAVLAHLFEPFFTTKEVGEGTGLGLAAIDGIMRDCLGFVTVDSTPGVGSTFNVFFPAADEVGAPPLPAPIPVLATPPQS
jgi:signal transduction histidine kinase